MKRTFLIAAAATLLMATTAQAGVFCTLLTVRDLKQVEYTFEPNDQQTYAEVRITRNGATLDHHNGRRPLWSYVDYGNEATFSSALQYNIDPRWRLMVRHDGERLSRAQALTNVVLMNDQQVVALGACLVTVAANGGAR